MRPLEPKCKFTVCLNSIHNRAFVFFRCCFCLCLSNRLSVDWMTLWKFAYRKFTTKEKKIAQTKLYGKCLNSFFFLHSLWVIECLSPARSLAGSRSVINQSIPLKFTCIRMYSQQFPSRSLKIRAIHVIFEIKSSYMTLTRLDVYSRVRIFSLFWCVATASPSHVYTKKTQYDPLCLSSFAKSVWLKEWQMRKNSVLLSSDSIRRHQPV